MQKLIIILIALSVFSGIHTDAVAVATTEGSGVHDSSPGLGENHSPQIKSATFADPYIHHGVDIFVIPDVFDADGDDVFLTYRWFLNGEELLEENEPVLSGDRFVKGDKVALWIVPADKHGSGKTFYGSEFIIPNAPPEFAANLTASFAGALFNFIARASDPDDDSLFFYLENAPAGMTIEENSGEINWERAEQSGPFHFKVVVQDSDGAETTLPVKIGG